MDPEAVQQNGLGAIAWGVAYAILIVPPLTGALASLVAFLVMARLAARERREARGTIKLLSSGRRSPADIGQLKRAVRSMADAAESRPIEVRDVLSWTGGISVAFPALAAMSLGLSYFVAHWLIAIGPVVLLAWWLDLQRRGVRAASLYPSASWSLAMAIVLAILLLQADAIEADESVVILQDWWLGFAWPTEVVGAVALCAAVAAAVAIILRDRAPSILRPSLWFLGIVSAAAVWSTMHMGGYFVVTAAIFSGYAIARGARQASDFSEYLRMVQKSGVPLPLDVEQRRMGLDISVLRIDLSKRFVAAAGALGVVAGLARAIVGLEDAGSMWLLVAVAVAAAITPVLASANRPRLGDVNSFATGAVAAYVALFGHLAATGLSGGWLWDPQWRYETWGSIIATISVVIFAIPLIVTVAWFGSRAFARWGALMLSLSIVPIPVLAFASGETRSTEWAVFNLTAVCLFGAMALAFGPRRLERGAAATESQTDGFSATEETSGRTSDASPSRPLTGVSS